MALEPEKRQKLDGIATSLATIRFKVEGNGPATEAVDAATGDFHAAIDRVIEKGTGAVDALVRDFAEVIARHAIGLRAPKPPPSQEVLDALKKECPYIFRNHETKTRTLLLILSRQLSARVPGAPIADEMGITEKALYAVASNLEKTLSTNRSIYTVRSHAEGEGIFSYEIVLRGK